MVLAVSLGTREELMEAISAQGSRGWVNGWESVESEALIS